MPTRFRIGADTMSVHLPSHNCESYKLIAASHNNTPSVTSLRSQKGRPVRENRRTQESTWCRTAQPAARLGQLEELLGEEGALHHCGRSIDPKRKAVKQSGNIMCGKASTKAAVGQGIPRRSRSTRIHLRGQIEPRSGLDFRQHHRAVDTVLVAHVEGDDRRCDRRCSMDMFASSDCLLCTARHAASPHVCRLPS